MDKRSAIVIGAGIVGLATARALAQKGFSVKVFERSLYAAGASVRNFGMIWPIGQPAGKLYERAIRSRETWKEIAAEAKIFYDPVGSLQLAYHPKEWQVLQEVHDLFCQEGRRVELLAGCKAAEKSKAVLEKNLLGALYSMDEVIVDPREAMKVLPQYLAQKFGIQFFWGKCVTYVSDQTVYIGNKEEHEAELVFVCSGADFETLYPEEFACFAPTRCKIQMMSLETQPEGWRIGPALCGGLSLVHYAGFGEAPSLPELKRYYQEQWGSYLDWGIHVMVAQNSKGELIIGDSHEYGLVFDPFDKEFIYKLILDYLKRFAQFKSWSVSETWHGILPKMTNGASELFFSPAPCVYILSGLAGAGMTLSFGLTEELIAGI
jgi:FAD dependent oxidoreductase TIGR03364